MDRGWQYGSTHTALGGDRRPTPARRSTPKSFPSSPRVPRRPELRRNSDDSDEGYRFHAGSRVGRSEQQETGM